jgi:hypothetical protein
LNANPEIEGEEHPVKEKEMKSVRNHNSHPEDKNDSWWKRLRCL